MRKRQTSTQPLSEDQCRGVNPQLNKNDKCKSKEIKIEQAFEGHAKLVMGVGLTGLLNVNRLCIPTEDDKLRGDRSMKPAAEDFD